MNRSKVPSGPKTIQINGVAEVYVITNRTEFDIELQYMVAELFPDDTFNHILPNYYDFVPFKLSDTGFVYDKLDYRYRKQRYNRWISIHNYLNTAAWNSYTPETWKEMAEHEKYLNNTTVLKIVNADMLLLLLTDMNEGLKPYLTRVVIFDHVLPPKKHRMWQEVLKFFPPGCMFFKDAYGAYAKCHPGPGDFLAVNMNYAKQYNAPSSMNPSMTKCFKPTLMLRMGHFMRGVYLLIWYFQRMLGNRDLTKILVRRYISLTYDDGLQGFPLPKGYQNPFILYPREMLIERKAPG